LFGREDKGGFGKIELPCNLLHLNFIEPFCFRQDCQLIAAEWSWGEDIADEVAIFQKRFLN